MSQAKLIIDKISNYQKTFNIFTSYLQSYSIKNDSTLMIAAVKDNIVTKKFKTTCCSDILKEYQSPYDATCVKLLKDTAIVIGKTNMDEFGMGSYGVHSNIGPVINPLYLKDKRVVGGSSSGSAAAVACDLVDFSLGTDTCGSVRLLSAFT